MLLAIDPGADAGWALFEKKELVACGLNPHPAKTGAVDVVLIERPKIYPGARQKARADDVVTLAVRAGEYGGRFEAQSGEVRYVEPHKWKGGAVPKEIHHPRIWSRLAAHEQEILHEGCKGMAPSKRHNVVDAVGLGLYGVGRAA